MLKQPFMDARKELSATPHAWDTDHHESLTTINPTDVFET
jgi:hypothetical protein